MEAKMIEKNEKIYVAIGAIPTELEIKDVYPCERKAEIDRCANPRVRKEKYFAWELLKNTVEKNLNIPFESLCFEKNRLINSKDNKIAQILAQNS